MNVCPHSALLFDMDGVIVNSTAIHTRAWIEYLSREGVEVAGIEQRMLGKHNDEIVRDFFAGRELSEEDVVRHGHRKERLYRRIIAPEIEAHIVPGVRAFLERHEGEPIGLASNAEEANVSFVLDAAGLRSYFGVVVSGREVANPKPAPDIYLHAAERLGCAPEACVVFEDSLTGVAAARSAGMFVVGVTTTLAELPGVDLAIRDFEDPKLEEWLRDVQLAA